MTPHVRARIIALAARLDGTIELGLKIRTIRSGQQVMVETLNRPGSFVGHYPKRVTVLSPKKNADVSINKRTAREADIDLIQTPTADHGTFRNVGTVKGFVPVIKNLKKNRVAIEYDPQALSRSSRKGAVTNDADLNSGYLKIAKRIGYTHRQAGAYHRLEP